ncbi:hypothetical protein [Klebsiella phage pKV-BS375-3.1]|nr:hypothetical protein [Klebsiella phage pKV-BS375-3.1]
MMTSPEATQCISMTRQPRIFMANCGFLQRLRTAIFAGPTS